MTKFGKVIYRRFFSRYTFKTLQDVQRSQIRSEFIDLKDQTSSINGLSSLLFLFKQPLVDALN